MKTVVEASGKNIIISFENRVQYDGKDVRYTDRENSIAVHKRNVTDIHFYEDEYCENGRTGRAIRIELRVDDILKIAAEISKINADTFECKYTEPEDLPW